MGQEIDQTEKSFWFGIYLDAINMWIQNKLMEIKQWLKNDSNSLSNGHH